MCVRIVRQTDGADWEYSWVDNVAYDAEMNKIIMKKKKSGLQMHIHLIFNIFRRCVTHRDIANGDTGCFVNWSPFDSGDKMARHNAILPHMTHRTFLHISLLVCVFLVGPSALTLVIVCRKMAFHFVDESYRYYYYYKLIKNARNSAWIILNLFYAYADVVRRAVCVVPQCILQMYYIYTIIGEQHKNNIILLRHSNMCLLHLADEVGNSS